MNLSSLLLSSLVLTSVLPVFGQGTRADYERANSLRQRTASKVIRASVVPNWIGTSGRFWYRNDLADGRTEFVLVDPAVPTKKPAFDQARLAIALSKTLGKPVTADRLPIEALTFEAEKSLRLRVENKSYLCDLTTYALRPSDTAIGQAPPLPIEEGQRSANSAVETTLTFQNKTADEVGVYWLDTEGKPHSYGTLKPDETRTQNTYVGHFWTITKQDRPFVAFLAETLPRLAIISGIEPKPAPRSETAHAVSPDGKWQAVIHDSNLFLRDTKTGAETPLTKDGSPADAYTEPLIWSPDGAKLVALKTIPAQEHKVFTVESSPKDQLQPKLHTLDYLKPGDRIEHPRPHLFDIAAKRDIPIADTLFSNPWEISELRWEPDGKRFTFLYNQRGHQVMRLIAVDAEMGAATVLINEEAKTFIDWTAKVFLQRLDKTQEAVWMSERDGWNHLYLYDTKTGQVKNQITKGNWVVRGVERVDAAKRQIWFRAGGILSGQDPYHVHYARINFDGTGLTLLTEGDGTHSLVYSPDGKTFVDTYSRADLPPVTELRRADNGKKIMDLEKGDASALLATGWRFPERFVAKGRDGKTDIYGLIFRPSNFDPKRKYPVIENIYAGPQSSHVPKAFLPANGSQSMAELGFIVVQMDGMGTSNRSKAFHDVCWHNLADAGFPDRILWIKAAAAKYAYMDLSRVGIYGTSAGGQNALGGLLLHGDFYKVGMADCGCHDNRMDKIWWNEQWMGWPIGPHYAEQSNVTLASKLQGKLLLMVGELDTNVDPASTMQVVNALIKANKDFDLLVVPGADHGVVGIPYARRKMQDFFVRNMLGVEPRLEAKTQTAGH